MKVNLPKSALIPASDYVIFGGTGDLATRKILPALFWRFLDGQINENFNIFVCSRKETTMELLEQRISEQELGIWKENKLSWKKFKKLIKLQSKTNLSNDIVSLSIDDVVYKVPKFIVNEEIPDNYSNKTINQALAFTRNLLLNKFYLPNNLFLPRSRVFLENSFS